MKVLAWVTEATWPACVAALRDHVPPDAQVTLLYVIDDELLATSRGAVAGLLGRSGGSVPAAGVRLSELAAHEGHDLLAAAAAGSDREVFLEQRHGRVEREVVAAAAQADLLVLARDGDLHRLGPHSFAPTTRFVVDHAPCATLLVWPSAAPTIGSLPPPPPKRPR
jgi:nucleotide-binding universal stress UspA family protein